MSTPAHSLSSLSANAPCLMPSQLPPQRPSLIFNRCCGMHLGSFAPRCKGCKCTVCGDAYVGTPSRRCNCGCRVRTGNVCSTSLKNSLYKLAPHDSRIHPECWKFLAHPRLLLSCLCICGQSAGIQSDPIIISWNPA